MQSLMNGIQPRSRGLMIALAMAGLCTSLRAEPKINPEAMTELERIRPKGASYAARVPDTLDLAERARLAINNLTRAPWDTVLSSGSLTRQFGDVPLMGTDEINQRLEKSPPFVNIKQLRTLPMLRAMCGSEQNLDVEAEAMRAQLHELLKSMTAGTTTALESNRRLGVPVSVWHDRDPDPAWLEALGLVAESVRKSIIRVEDRAYFPTSAENNQFVQYTPPDEPPIDQVGREGTVRWDQSWGLRALVRDYMLNGTRESLEVARMNMRFLLKPGMWENDKGDIVPGNQSGHWAGHFHGGLTGFHAMLEFAVATNDDRLKQMLWQAYDHGRMQGVVRMGWFPMWFPAESYNRPREQSSYCEGCGIADLVVMAVKLMDAGLGDYWDDVDFFARNHLTEPQFTNMDQLKAAVGHQEKFNGLLERMLGGFGLNEPTVNGYIYTEYRPQVVAGCCSPNAAQALYYAWHGIVRENAGIATVNLLLNRASPWLDIESDLPYAGHVRLKNKTARMALVRMPRWVELGTLTVQVNQREVKPGFSGRHVVVEGLKADDVIDLRFDVPLFEHEAYKIYDTEYSIDFRGSTITRISPRRAEGAGYIQLYERGDVYGQAPPRREVERFVSERLITPQ